MNCVPSRNNSCLQSVVPEPAASTYHMGNLVEIQILGPHSRATKSAALRVKSEAL